MKPFRALVSLLQLRGVPARVNQGLLLPKPGEATRSAHAWAEARLPRMKWAPIDPVLRRGVEGEADERYLGQIPADRVTLVIGTEATIPADGDIPAVELSGPLTAPAAWKGGKRVGEVTWKATIEPLE